MNFKSVCAVTLVLLFQLGQLIPAAWAAMPPGCATSAPACDCCKDMDRCPCVSEAPEEKPSRTPVDAPSGEIKVPAARWAPISPALVGLPQDLKPAGAFTSRPQEERISGYSGVALEVTFCSFVI